MSKLPIAPLALACLLATPLAAPPAAAEQRTVPLEARRDLVLTAYQNGLALIHDTRWVPLVAGDNRLVVEGVSPQVLAESLQVAGGDGLSLREQSVLAADLTPEELLRRAVGQRVRLARRHPESGEDVIEPALLLSMAAGPVLQVGDRIEVAPPGRILLSDLPEGLRAEPALQLRLDSPRTAPAELTLAYLIGGLSWQADYIATLAPDGAALSLLGRVSLDNRSGVPFGDAALRLVAGEVSRRSGPQPDVPMAMLATGTRAMAAEAMPAPVAAGDRYLYDTGRRIDLAAGERKQITLFEAASLLAERFYRLKGLATAGGGEIEWQQAQIVVESENRVGDRDTRRPLPAGVVRLYETVAGGPELFVGEDTLSHTPEGGKITLHLGRAFDITGKARQTAFERLSDRSFESAHEVVLRNAKAEAVEVEVIGRFPPGWRMVEESAPHDSETAAKIVWRLAVPAGGETSLTYRVRVSR